MTAWVLQTDGLSKRYRGRLAVDALSLHVARGDIYGFLGQNGAGKSTTIRMMLGLVRPTAGHIKLLGYDMARHPRRALRRVGAIVEAPAFYDNFTGRQNLRLLASLSGGATRSQLDHALELVGLQARADEPVRVYSYGMRQRLGLAQALLPAPEFIVLDEPTNGLDPQGIHEWRRLIHRLRAELNLTVLLSSHLLAEVEQLCNRVAIIDAGRLVYEGAVAQLVAETETVKLTVDNPDLAYQLLAGVAGVSIRRNGAETLYIKTRREQLPVVNAMLVAHGLKVFELAPQRETLEQVFLRLTAPEANAAPAR